MEVDDTDGAGPEWIVMEIPDIPGKQYSIGVHYWADHGFGTSYATIKVWFNDVLVHQETSGGLEKYDMWEVGSIDGGTGAFSISGKIINNYINPFFYQP